MNDADLAHLRRSIEIAESARLHGNHPFGALLVSSDGEVLAEAENTVVTGPDATGHAELNLVRTASSRFDTEVLSRSTLFTSTEPCAMCAGAIHWSHIGRVVYALSEADLYSIIGPSPEHLLLPCREVFGRSQQPIEVIGPVSAVELEARAVHADFWTLARRTDGS